MDLKDADLKGDQTERESDDMFSDDRIVSGRSGKKRERQGNMHA